MGWVWCRCVCVGGGGLECVELTARGPQAEFRHKRIELVDEEEKLLESPSLCAGLWPLCLDFIPRMHPLCPLS